MWFHSKWEIKEYIKIKILTVIVSIFYHLSSSCKTKGVEDKWQTMN